MSALANLCSRSVLLATLGVVALAELAAASDGRTELSQAQVTADGGYPYKISKRGSYVLTSDLVVDAGKHGLEILADGVRVDLNGFAIRSTHVCSAGTCPAGIGVGVLAGAAGSGIARFTTVVHGEISGFGSNCIELGPGARIDDVIVHSCGASGVFAQEHSQVTSSRISECGLFGIQLNGPGAYAHDVISLVDLGTGTGGHVSGGFSGDGNVCDIARCPRSRRRYYQTQASYFGNHGASVCEVGFHMAATAELAQPSGLEYDTSLGAVSEDSGAGPPNQPGWIRSGQDAGSTEDCNNSGAGPWTSPFLADAGALLQLWDPGTAPQAAWPWTAIVGSCSNQLPVWCIED